MGGLAHSEFSSHSWTPPVSLHYIEEFCWLRRLYTCTQAHMHSRPCSLSVGLVSGVVIAGSAQTWLTPPPGLRVTLRSRIHQSIHNHSLAPHVTTHTHSPTLPPHTLHPFTHPLTGVSNSGTTLIPLSLAYEITFWTSFWL